MNCIPANDPGLTAEALRVGCRTEPVWIRCVHKQCTASIFYVRRNLSLIASARTRRTMLGPS